NSLSGNSQMRPPIRSRASRMATRWPARASSRPAIRPADPAPMTMIWMRALLLRGDLVEIEPHVVVHLDRGGTAGADHAAARMLERSDQIKPLDPRHGVIAQLRRRPMRARLIGVGRDAVNIAAAEARRCTFHVERRVVVMR